MLRTNHSKKKTSINHHLLILFKVLVVLILPNWAVADVNFGGSLRVRLEDKLDFNLNDSEQDYTLTQLRLNMDWKPSRNNQFYIELQDSRVFGENRVDFPPINDDARNQPFADSLDFHQFYYQHQWDEGKVRLGRQKLNLGDQRLVASLEWVNTARVHDGARLTFGSSDSKKVNIFATRLVSVDPNELNDQSPSNNRYFDSEFHGIFVSDKTTPTQGSLEYWYFLRRNSNIDDTIHTIGARYASTIASWKLDIQAAFQSGDFGSIEHSASMYHVGIDQRMLGGNLGFAYNYASGDSNQQDNKHGTFDNLYPLNHAYYGFMDLFSLQNIHNFEAVYKTSVFGKSQLRVGWQSFWLADTKDAWYNAGLRANEPRRIAALDIINSGGDVDSFVGNEIDFTVKYPFSKKWFVLFGYSHFFAGDYTKDTGSSRDADFFFVMSKISF